MAHTTDRLREALAPTGHTLPILAEGPREHSAHADFSHDLHDVAATLPGVIDRAMQTALPERYTPELAAEFAETMAFLLAQKQEEHAERVQVAEDAIRTALRARLDGLITNPRDLADQLHTVIEDAQAEHLARPEVGGFPIDDARSHEAFSTAVQAVNRALRLTANRAQTVAGLRAMLEMAIDEAGA